MIVKILWSFVAVVTLYVIAIFFFPAQADEVGELLGIRELNSVLREIQQGGVEDARISVDWGTSGYLNEFQNKIDSARDAVEQTKATIWTKVEQTKKVVDSVQKTAWAIEELKTNVSDLTSLTGSSWTGSSSSWTTSSTWAVRKTR